MVYYFLSQVVTPPVQLFMGLDKHENEKLIKWGWPEDVWFHVNKMSSAHVYLRLKPNETIEDIPQSVIDDAAQLCKANSIQGNKVNNVEVVYTMWSNLRKTAGMDVGEVGFFDNKAVKKVTVDKRINEIVNRLNKTKDEKYPDLQLEKEERDRAEIDENKKQIKARELEEKKEREKRAQEKELRSYTNMFSADSMKTNKDGVDYDSDDFM